ncbi:hypothetical protein C2S52_001520 [Perilla frutescens var. hirtella]|nr:hypothetical protein C2S52_001520 [Perilla frutescens var. hirtella]
MDKHFCFLILTIFWGIVGPQCWAVTDILEVQTLQDLYRSLNSPMQLEHWKAESGDPCEETWKGVQCLGSSLITLDLHGLELAGNLGVQLSNLKSLKHLDLSSNNIEGSIAYGLPPNVTHLILAENKLSGTIPYSIGKMKHLRHLNFSNNMLSGSLGDVFNGLENLKEMDLLFNYFTGNLPSSFRSLTNLTGLFLQNNQLIGSVISLVNLSLTDLNIEDNYFSGMIPENFQNILNLRIAGNNFLAETNYGPWMFPSDTMPRKKDITITPAANLIAIEAHPSQSAIHKKRKQTFKIIIIIGVITLAATFLIPMVIARRQRSRLKRCRDIVSPGEPVSPHESVKSLSPDANLDHTSISVRSGSDASSFSSSPTSTSSGSPFICTSSDSTWIKRIVSKRSFSMREVSIGPRMYSTEKFRIATNNFSKENFIGEMLALVHRTKGSSPIKFSLLKLFVAIQSFSVLYILGPVDTSLIEKLLFDTVFLIQVKSELVQIGGEPEKITKSRVTWYEHFQPCSPNLIIILYIISLRNFSLDEALHCVAHRPLPSCVRLQIALGIARALEYLHSSCVPPIAHSNLKAANILLDEELKPFVCDCDLAIFSSRFNSGDIEADVYAFGVLLLEQLTGRKPIDSCICFNSTFLTLKSQFLKFSSIIALFLFCTLLFSSRPKEELSLVSWASSKLNDGVSFEHIVDPAITRAIPSRWLSRLAYIVSLCIQELSPTMSVIVGSLTPLLQRLTGLFEHGTDALAGAIEFSYDELVNATVSFSSECLIEDSYFWKVYKGTFANNKIYAVKHLENALLRRTDDQIVEEVSKLHNWSHPNLMRMIG